MIRNTGAVLYGTITVGALLAAESAKRETYGRTVGAVAIAMVLYWLVHAYSGFTEQRVARNQPLALSDLARTLAQELMIIGGAALPLLALLVCWATGASLSSAVNVAVWTSAVMILIVEVVAGVRAELSGRELVAQTAFGASFGLLVIILNVLLR
jgi:NADH:ubiquinone oxidoreductase subunit 6 (subunit J)